MGSRVIQKANALATFLTVPLQLFLLTIMQARFFDDS